MNSMHRALLIAALLASLSGCASEPVVVPQPPVNEKLSALEADVAGQGETIEALNTRLIQTNERLTRQTIQLSNLLQIERRRTGELERQTEQLERQEARLAGLDERYRALRQLILQQRIDEVQDRIERLTELRTKLRTQLNEEQAGVDARQAGRGD